MNTRQVLGLAIGLALSAAVQVAPSASAAPAPSPDTDSVRVAVRTSDLDLTRADGVKTLLVRLRHAASFACSSQSSGPGDFAARRAYAACYRTSLDGAVRQLHAPLVADLYYGRDQATTGAGGPA